MYILDIRMLGFMGICIEVSWCQYVDESALIPFEMKMGLEFL